MTAVVRTRRVAVVAGVFVAGLVLVGCADAGAMPAVTDAAPPAAGGEGSLSALEHVHEVAFDEDGLVLASHQGVYAVDLDTGALTLVGGAEFDAMGLAVTDAGVLASGHPGALVDEVFTPPNIGLISDSGSGWRSLSLAGEVDFHALTASADGVTVAGLPSGEPVVLHSPDGGTSWLRGASIEARDLALVGDTLVATTAEGAQRSTDGGASFTPIDGAPLLVLVAADPMTPGQLVGIDASGAVVRGSGDDWQTIGQAEGTPAAIAADATGTLALVDARGLVVSRDAGDSWQVLIPAE